MKKLINACRVVQTVSAIIASLAIIMLASAYEPSTKSFIIMGIVFLVAVIVSAIMALIIDLTKDCIRRHESVQQRSCRAFYNCKHDSKGFYLKASENER